MICCRDVTEGRDQGYLLSKLSCAELKSEMRGAPGWLRALELPGWKRHRGKEQLLEWLRSDGGSWLLEHLSSSYISLSIISVVGFRSIEWPEAS